MERTVPVLATFKCLCCSPSHTGDRTDAHSYADKAAAEINLSWVICKDEIASRLTWHRVTLLRSQFLHKTELWSCHKKFYCGQAANNEVNPTYWITLNESLCRPRTNTHCITGMSGSYYIFVRWVSEFSVSIRRSHLWHIKQAVNHQLWLNVFANSEVMTEWKISNWRVTAVCTGVKTILVFICLTSDAIRGRTYSEYPVFAGCIYYVGFELLDSR